MYGYEIIQKFKEKKEQTETEIGKDRERERERKKTDRHIERKKECLFFQSMH